MLKVGLTGGIGCGKSSAVASFKQFGIPVVDADQIARAVVALGEPTLPQIAAKFGAEALTEQGELNRAWMRERVFADPTARERLEAILHPAIRARLDAGMQVAAEQGAPYVIVDIPLLVERHYQSLFDRIIVVDCLPEQQIARVRQRDGSDEAQISHIMAAQASRELRLRYATDVLDNTGTLAQLTAQVQQLHQTFLAMSKAASSI